MHAGGRRRKEVERREELDTLSFAPVVSLVHIIFTHIFLLSASLECLRLIFVHHWCRSERVRRRSGSSAKRAPS